jgi:predicted PurR-regulated permease PerM
VVVGFLYFARDVVVPITLAILLSFLLSPAVRALRRWHATHCQYVLRRADGHRHDVIGIPHAALWAIFVVLLRFVPYLGIVIAACFPLALAIAVDPGWTLLLWTISLFVVVELIVTNFVEPWVYGSSAGLSPVALIVAAVWWTWLWGPIGLLLSTPVTACLVVLGRHVRHLEFLDVLLGNEPVLTPEETFADDFR